MDKSPLFNCINANLTQIKHFTPQTYIAFMQKRSNFRINLLSKPRNQLLYQKNYFNEFANLFDRARMLASESDSDMMKTISCKRFEWETIQMACLRQAGFTYLVLCLSAKRIIIRPGMIRFTM